ncbi:hypothetical protein DL96DRAFT_1622922 [Flagelloscypha sp. PMI_526]|nr:hypothetical protein DL96DRAFT_1622922 [Flagelloscypha sp. PMI_526]
MHHYTGSRFLPTPVRRKGVSRNAACPRTITTFYEGWRYSRTQSPRASKRSPSSRSCGVSLPLLLLGCPKLVLQAGHLWTFLQSLWLDAASPLALASLHITMLIKDNKSPPRSNMISAWHSNIALALVYAIALVWGAGFLINLVESALLLKSDHDQGFGMGMLWSAILEILTSGAGNVLTWTFLLNTTMEQRQEARRQAYARPDMAERQAWNH